MMSCRSVQRTKDTPISDGLAVLSPPFSALPLGAHRDCSPSLYRATLYENVNNPQFSARRRLEDKVQPPPRYRGRIGRTSNPPVLPHSWNLDPCNYTSPTRPINVPPRTRQDGANPTGKDRVLVSRGSLVRGQLGVPEIICVQVNSVRCSTYMSHTHSWSPRRR